MGLAYSMLTLLVLETSDPGAEGFSSAALQLMFTLGTAFGAGDRRRDRGAGRAGRGIGQAIGIVVAIMAVVAAAPVAWAGAVPRGPSEQPARERRPVRPAPLEHL